MKQTQQAAPLPLFFRALRVLPIVAVLFDPAIARIRGYGGLGCGHKN
jgi:hypothetical protein